MVGGLVTRGDISVMDTVSLMVGSGLFEGAGTTSAVVQTLDEWFEIYSGGNVDKYLKGAADVLKEVFKDSEVPGLFKDLFDTKINLFVDGKIISGQFGSPIWSQAENKFLVIENNNGNLVVSKL